ncbi:MAG: amino acid transporter [Alphaproteobacteria bacterium]|nr:MAG: amino acid transporter [Alphaproteobacteria bacterium]
MRPLPKASGAWKTGWQSEQELSVAVAAINGFLLGAGLIIAIGAQNAFVLRQGLARSHVFVICLICALSDAVLIALGVGGLGTLVSNSPLMIRAVTIGGAGFLFVYGVLAFRRVLSTGVLKAGREKPAGLAAAIAACLAFTFLNPHVYLDTLVLIGALSASYAGAARLAFGAGAVLASFVWFFGLGYGARWLAPVFAARRAWQVLDIFIGAIMWSLAAGLTARVLSSMS